MYLLILTSLCFFFLQRITISAATNTSSTAYSPIENIALNCGASENSTAVDGRVWVGDIGSAFASFRQANDTSIISKPLHNDVSNIVPFTTARIFPCQYTYTFPVTAGPKFIRLHFYPATYPGFSRSESLFSIKAGPYTLLGDFNASLVADDLGLKHLSKEFCLTVEQNETLNLTFSPLPATPLAHAFINGIEIVSMPTNLYYTRPGDIGIPFVGQRYQFSYIDNKTAIETVYRLNVGGVSISPMNDAGMLRRWSQDDDYVVEIGALPVNISIAIKYTRTPEYAAPIELYKTSRSMGNDKAQNERYNLTWEFPVDSGFMYLIRLHFCEFQPEITQVGDREFHIFIDDQIAEVQADVISWAGGNGIPVYKDYIVMMEGDAIEGRRNLSIALHPNADFRTRYSDAILNGLEMFKVNDSYGNLFLQPHPPTSKHSTGKETLFLAVGAIIIGVAVVIALSGFTVFRRRKRSESGTRNTWSPPHQEVPLCRRFSLAEIRTATENFSDSFVIGSGGFGKVYKGLINGGGTAVAIKRLTRGSNQGAREFWTEINMLSQLRHTHLVSLIGYCNDHQEMILVYEFMAHGTLADHLYKNREHGNPLPWKQRLEICIGAARGLEYLHAGEQHRIIHGDVKTSNILLDENWVAKVADFGLSKLGTTQSWTHIRTDVKGTFGYLDPEYYWTHRLTEKSDVFAFGVVLFESLCGRPAVDMTLEEEEESLCHWAQHCVKEGTLDQIIDPHLLGTITPRCLAVFVGIANKCLLGSRIERPTMTDVVRCLELALTLQESNNAAAAAAEEEVIDVGGVARTRSASLLEDTSHRIPIRFFSENGRINLPERSIISASDNLCLAVNHSERHVF